MTDPPRSRSIRISLQQQPSTLSSFGSFKTTCLSKHYALNRQILAAFDSDYQNQLWEMAYQYGVKFVESALLEIPQHGYFYSDKYAEGREESSREALRVCSLLETILMMNRGKKGSPFSAVSSSSSDFVGALETRKIQLLHDLAWIQYHHPLPSYEKFRKKTSREIANLQQQQQAASTTTTATAGSRHDSQHRTEVDTSSMNHLVTSTLLACGDSFTSVFCPGGLSSSSSNLQTQDQTHPYYHPQSHRHSSQPDERYSYNKKEKKAFPPSHDDNDDEPGSSDTSSKRLYPSFSSEDRQPDESSSTTRTPFTRASRSIWPHHQSPPPGGRKSSYEKGPARDDQSSFTSLLDQAEEQQQHQYPPFQRESSGLSRPLFLSRSQSEYDLQRALFISGLHIRLQDDSSSFYSSTQGGQLDESTTPSERLPSAPPGAKKRTLEPSLDILATCYHEDFDVLCQRGRISVRKLPTFQGRVPGSINGCTVIAPLLCIHHFVNDNAIPDRGLPDEAIVHVIDQETPNILPKIRETLGLVKDAFLIPMDAHDSLMEQNYMCQEQFLTVCGGNILDEGHLEAFILELSVVGPKKLAATFFFHEHVITILQLRHDSKSAWFELIDSLPHEDTFLQMGGDASASTAPVSDPFSVGRSRTGTGRKSSSRSSLVPMESRLRAAGGRFERDNVFLIDEDNNDDDDEMPPPPLRPDAVRIRCMDAESLKVTLMWYACSVFSADNRAYIDAYEWDEQLADFDPRVFQAFLWTEAS